ncbi:FliI/YscN family ATPase [Thiolapillus sp.]
MTVQGDIFSALRHAQPLVRKGRVVQAYGTTVRVSGLHARIGQQCLITDRQSGYRVVADVVGLEDGQAILLPLGNLQGIAAHADVELLQEQSQVVFGDALLGRILDGLGQPLDGRPLPEGLSMRPLHAEAPAPLQRQPIREQFSTGVRAIDAMLTTGVGQRLGVFAMAGGGKSTLLAMLAKQASTDVIVIGLIGERGREVHEFIEQNLGKSGLCRSVVVVSTSDRPAMERVRAAHAAMAIAEGFREQGKQVLLLMDSVTRFARALREIGLSVGEPAVRRGYPPSVFAELPRLFERSGNDHRGSITAFFTVLTEDEHGEDPIAEEVRSILDGHIVLTRELARRGHYPPIDVLASASRLFSTVASREQQEAAHKLRSLLAKYDEIELLLQVGEYREGADMLADEAIAKRPAIEQLCRQHPEESSDLEQAVSLLLEVAGSA